MEDVRFATVAGKFYPLDKGELQLFVEDSLSSRPSKTSQSDKLKALVVPHSGYEFCVDVMASAYSELLGRMVDEVFILAHSHFHELNIAAFSEFKYWETPLGQVQQSRRIPQIVHSDDSASIEIFRIDNDKHHGEHSIEVQLPYLQSTISGDFRIVPIILGGVSPRLVASSIEKFIDPDDLIVVPAELSHGYPVEYATDIDTQILDKIMKLDIDFITGEKCEVTNKISLAALLTIAEQNDWKPQKLSYMTSAETHPDKDKVSGYAAIGFYE